MLYTTLAAIRAHSPCESGWIKLLRHLGKTKADDKPLALSVVLESNGVADALWCLRACDGADMFARRFALDVAKCMYPIWHAKYPNDPRIENCIDVIERYLGGKATKEELLEARAAAYAAAADAAYADADADDAAYAAYAAAADAAYADADARRPTRKRVWQERHLAACLEAWPEKPWPKFDVID